MKATTTKKIVRFEVTFELDSPEIQALKALVQNALYQGEDAVMQHVRGVIFNALHEVQA